MAKEPDGLSGQRDTLEGSIDGLQSCLLWFIGVVVLGLIVELYVTVAIFAQTRDVLHLVEGIGTFLVVVGVGGELVIEFRVRRKEQALRKVNSDIEAEYKVTLAAADEKIGELKAQLAPRTLSESYQALIAEQLVRFSGQRVAFVSNRQKEELRRWSAVLVNVFLRSRWQVVSLQLPPLFPLPQDAMIVVVHPEAGDRTRQAARALVRELLKADHDIQGPFPAMSAGFDTDVIVLALGAKP